MWKVVKYCLNDKWSAVVIRPGYVERALGNMFHVGRHVTMEMCESSMAPLP